MITSINLYEFWIMETYLIYTTNMVAFLMALGVWKFANNVVDERRCKFTLMIMGLPFLAMASYLISCS